MPLLTDQSIPRESRLKGRTPRSYSVSTKLTRKEFEAVATAARDSGKAIGEWARETILQQACGTADRLPNEALMVELTGVHLFLLNALAPLVRGETLTAGRYQSLVRQVREAKHEAAKNAIAAYRSARQNELKG
ncbi:MAG: hypothetical protein WBP85_07855 [Terracidiphilus sp.]